METSSHDQQRFYHHSNHNHLSHRQQPSKTVEPRHQQDNLPDYCRKLTVRDSNGVLKEMIFPKALDLDRPKRARTTFSNEQLLSLEEAFKRNHYMIGKERNDLARTLSLSETQVKVWFQNRRTKFKRDQGGSSDPADSGDQPLHAIGGTRGFPCGVGSIGPLDEAPQPSDSPQRSSPDRDAAAAAKQRAPPAPAEVFVGEVGTSVTGAAHYMYGMPWYHQCPAPVVGSSAGSPFLMPPMPPPPPQQQAPHARQQLESLGPFQLGSQAFCNLHYGQFPNIFKPRAL